MVTEPGRASNESDLPRRTERFAESRPIQQERGSSGDAGRLRRPREASGGVLERAAEGWRGTMARRASLDMHEAYTVVIAVVASAAIAAFAALVSGGFFSSVPDAGRHDRPGLFAGSGAGAGRHAARSFDRSRASVGRQRSEFVARASLAHGAA